MFKLHSKFKPSGDQPEAIDALVKGLNEKKKHQVLLGATGTGKTFTIANVIARTNKQTLVLAHNKTLAGQLYSELKELFPENHVEYFVSYYDYYQPEAYVPSSDTYIEKDASINDEIDELRHAATSSLIAYDDTIVVASVSCIYGIGEKEEYERQMLTVKTGEKVSRDAIIEKLVTMLYERNDFELTRGTFRLRGDTLDIMMPSRHEEIIRVEFFDDEVDRISIVDPITGVIKEARKAVSIFPASHFVTSEVKREKALVTIKEELDQRLAVLEKENKLLEYQRLKERTLYDLEMLRETGFCSGVENYSRHFDGRKEGEAPPTLIDFFKDDFLLVVDESHVTLPQVRAMYNGDRARKEMLVNYGFRLPSALDNRPLKFSEFAKKINQAIYVSATPGDYEMELVDHKFVEQIIRPTGLLDPLVEVRRTDGQIHDLLEEIRKRNTKGEKTLITTLTIKMSEELTDYLKNEDIRVAYLHSEIKTLERLQIIHDLRSGIYDVLVGINLLREGLDIPEVSLIAILDADKEGFLRSYRSLIQTMGRCARNASGKVIMYADKITDSMKEAIDETSRRRKIQDAYNKEHGIIPRTIEKPIREVVSNIDTGKGKSKHKNRDMKIDLDFIRSEMNKAAENLDFERAIEMRNILLEEGGSL